MPRRKRKGIVVTCLIIFYFENFNLEQTSEEVRQQYYHWTNMYRKIDLG